MTAVVTVWLVFCLGLVSAELNITCSQDGDYLRYTTLQTCECIETDRNSTLEWERSGGHVLVTGHGSVALDISFNASDPNATYICRSTRHSSTDNSTREHQQQFAYGPRDMTLDITPNSTSFDLCPPAPPIISVTCEGRPVNPRPPGYEIQIEGTAGNILLKSNHYAYKPKHGGVWTISCTTYNRIYPDINVTKSVSVTINEPPRMSPDLTIKNSKILNSSTIPHSLVKFNRSPVVLLEEGMMEVACSVQGGFPEVSSVTVTCDSLFKETVSGNSHSSSHWVNWTSTNTTCECTAQHVTGCYTSKSTVYLFVTSPLKWGAHARFQEMTSVVIGGIVHLELSVSGFPLPTVDSAVLRIGDSRLERGRYSVTLKRSGVGSEASVVLEMSPQSREDFNRYTLVISNQVNQMLEISFRIVEADASKEELVALIAGIAAPVGFIVIIIITVVFITRRMKRQPDISGPKGVDRASLHVMVPNEYAQFSSTGPVQSVYSGKVEIISVRPQSVEMSDGQDRVQQKLAGGQDQAQLQMEDGEDHVPQRITVVFVGGKRKNKKTTANYDNVNIKNTTLKKKCKQAPSVLGSFSGDDHKGRTEKGSKLKNPPYVNVLPKTLVEDAPPLSMNTKKNIEHEADDKGKLCDTPCPDERTEKGSKLKNPPYVNVLPKPLVEDTPPLSMNTKKTVEHEADDKVNPCVTPCPDEDQLLQGVTTPSREPLKGQLTEACRLSGYFNVQPGPNDAPGVKLTVSPERTSDVYP